MFKMVVCTDEPPDGRMHILITNLSSNVIPRLVKNNHIFDVFL